MTSPLTKGELPINHERDRECQNGHKWTSPVVLSPYTTNLSGERREFCPICNAGQAFAGPVRLIPGTLDDDDYERGAEDAQRRADTQEGFDD